MLRYTTLLLLLFCSFDIFHSPVLAQTRGAESLNQIKTEVAQASSASEIAKVLKRVEKANIFLSDMVSVRLSAHALLAKMMAGPKSEVFPTEMVAIVDLYHQNATSLKRDLEKLTNQLEVVSPPEFALVQAKVELAQLLERYEPRRTGPKRSVDDQRKFANSQSLYEEALAIQEKRGEAMSPDSLAIRVFLADSYVKSADFERALPLYETYIEGVTELESSRSTARIRALLSIAKISQLAGDEPRFRKLRTELEASGVSIENRVDISLRADREKKGVESGGGFIHGETFLYAAPNSPRMGAAYPGGPPLVQARPVYQPLTSGMYSGIPAIVSVDSAGAVTTVEVMSNEKKAKRSVESLVRKWRFRPFVYRGSLSPMKGLVYCWIKAR